MENCNENDFWAFFEVEMDSNLEEDTNKLISLIGIVTGHVAVLVMIIGAFWPLFGVGTTTTTLSWWLYIFMSLGFVSLGFMVWGLLTWIWADGDTNEARVFRAWRTNFLAQGSHAILEFVIFTTWLIISLVPGPLTDWYSFAYFLSALVLGAGALYMMFFLKGWWYNVDEMGMMRCDENWNLFAVDDADWEPWWGEEEDEAVEEMVEEVEEEMEEEW